MRWINRRTKRGTLLIIQVQDNFVLSVETRPEDVNGTLYSLMKIGKLARYVKNVGRN